MQGGEVCFAACCANEMVTLRGISFCRTRWVTGESAALEASARQVAGSSSCCEGAKLAPLSRMLVRTPTCHQHDSSLGSAYDSHAILAILCNLNVCSPSTRIISLQHAVCPDVAPPQFLQQPFVLSDRASEEDLMRLPGLSESDSRRYIGTFSANLAVDARRGERLARPYNVSD